MDSLDLYIKIRGTITYISDEIVRMPCSQGTKDQVLNICNSISSVLGKIGEVDDQTLMIGLNHQIRSFHPVIQELEKNEIEQIPFILLITHVGDMLTLMKQEQQL